MVLRLLNITGVLMFEDSAAIGDLHLAAEYIVIHGMLLIGSPSNHFRLALPLCIMGRRVERALLSHSKPGSLLGKGQGGPRPGMGLPLRVQATGRWIIPVWQGPFNASIYYQLIIRKALAADPLSM